MTSGFPRMHPERYREVLKQLTVIEKATGSSPPVEDNPGHVAERICQVADAAGSSLIVIGYQCSVTVVPAGG